MKFAYVRVSAVSDPQFVSMENLIQNLSSYAIIYFQCFVSITHTHTLYVSLCLYIFYILFYILELKIILILANVFQIGARR